MDLKAKKEELQKKIDEKLAERNDLAKKVNEIETELVKMTGGLETIKELEENDK